MRAPRFHDCLNENETKVAKMEGEGEGEGERNGRFAVSLDVYNNDVSSNGRKVVFSRKIAWPSAALVYQCACKTFSTRLPAVRRR